MFIPAENAADDDDEYIVEHVTENLDYEVPVESNKVRPLISEGRRISKKTKFFTDETDGTEYIIEHVAREF